MISGLHGMGMSGAALVEHRVDYISGQQKAFREGRFGEVGQVLADADLERLDDTSLVMIVRAVRPVRDRVPEWGDTVRRVTAELDRLGKDGRAILADIYAEDPGLERGASPTP